MKNSLMSAAGVAALAACTAAHAQTSNAGQDESAVEDVDQVIVTGVFREQRLEEAPVAVTALSEEEIRQAAPTSAADALKSVPGVFVNSGFGEIRNIVYSRGVSSFSNEAATGYFYVSLQEDGLPVTNLTANNYGPDYYARPDLTLATIEALRGGTATITGPNAPGGIFNYISKNGRDFQGGQIELKYGLEGNVNNPQYRADFYYGGEVPGAENLYFSVGGFYREAEGARSAGYDQNVGGQVRANLLWDYNGGEVRLTGKLLDDRNGFFEFLPARDFDDPRFVSGFDALDSFLPPASPHSWIDPNGDTAEWDASNLIRNEQRAITLNWDHEFGGGWSVSNDFRYADSTSDWNTGALILPVPITDSAIYLLTNTLGVPGTFTFTDRATGETVATVVSATGFDHTVVQSNLPAGNVLENGVLTQTALDPRREVEEFMNQFQVSKEFENHFFNLGVFYSHADFFGTSEGGGFGLSLIEDRPRLLDITLDVPGLPAPLQVTSPEGWSALGDYPGAGVSTDGSQELISVFFGHQWRLTDRLTLDWGLRYEDITYKATNTLAIAREEAFPPGTPFFGPDGNPFTLFDNLINVVGPSLSAQRDYDYLSYSVSAVYVFSDALNGYARFSSGRKAPDFDVIQSLDSQSEIDTQFIDPQEIQQAELGIKFNTDGLSIALFPFWSRLSNVVSGQVFFDENGDAFSPDPITGELVTLGVEIEADYQIIDGLSIRTALTVQDSTSRDFGFYIDPTPVRGDEIVVPIPEGEADNIADFMGRTTLSWQATSKLSSFLTWTYLGDRPANRQNTFILPAYSIVDLGASYSVNDALSFRVDVKNVLNKDDGILSWAPAGGFIASLDRQAFSPAQRAADPDQSFSILTAQPRALFLTASLRF